jgi:predicted RecB family endonuclease
MTVPFDREYFLSKAQADTAIIDLYQLVDGMVHRAVVKTVQFVEQLNSRNLETVQFTTAVNQYCRQFHRLLEHW